MSYCCRFLAFRRCSMLASIIVMYLWDGEKPTRSALVSVGLLIVGAVIASWDNLEADYLGIVMVWLNNFG